MVKRTLKEIRSFVRNLGYDIVKFESQNLGKYPYLDIHKFVSSKKPIIFDVGANEGQTLQSIKDVFDDYIMHAFEPSPTTFKILEKNTANHKNINLWNAGLGAQKGQLVLNETSGTEMSSFLEKGIEGWGEVVRNTTVKVNTVDDFCREKILISLTY
ncbi:MAG: FkbM family methyltransferase [Patiriisocius sp.]|uniref:FkbM family methyltransferase n=1 Tax=Patiriisocius sp. TaxID=2822396 RepID=UPI003EF33E25